MPDTKPLRKDAERNRQRILEAARTAFSERGLCVTLDDIAHVAGVGVGTVYRRFPDKAELIDAVFEERIEAVARLAEEALEMDDPWEGLLHFLTGGVECQLEDRALRELLFSSTRGLERVQCSRERIAPLAERLVVRAQQAGVVRADLSSRDLPVLMIMTVAALEFGGETAPDLWRRAQTLLLDGLRPARDDVSPLPAPALDVEQLDRAMSGRA